MAIKGQLSFNLGKIRQPGQFRPASNAASFYKSEGGADPSTLRPRSRQERFAIYQHYSGDKRRVDAGGQPSQELTSSYGALSRAIPSQAARARRVVEPTFDKHYNDNPYPTAESMARSVERGSLRVHPTPPDEETVAWSNSVNDDFRALHDTIAHSGAGASFSHTGETLAAEAHRSTLPKSAHRALVAEVVGQASYHEFAGDFVDQKGLYDVPDWAARGEPMPKAPKRKPIRVGKQLQFDGIS